MNMLLSHFMCRVIRSLEEEGRFGTARVHGSTMRAFESFVGHKRFRMEQLNRRVLSAFEFHLVSANRQWNTVSTYMRVLRAVYNRAVDAGLVPYNRRLFAGVYTGTRSDRRRALEPKDLSRLFHADLPSRQLSRTRDYCRLMFAMRGIPFADLVYLRKCDLQGDTLCYRRHKTGTPMMVELAPPHPRAAQAAAQQGCLLAMALPLPRPRGRCRQLLPPLPQRHQHVQLPAGQTGQVSWPGAPEHLHHPPQLGHDGLSQRCASGNHLAGVGAFLDIGDGALSEALYAGARQCRQPHGDEGGGSLRQGNGKARRDGIKKTAITS